MYRVLYRKYRPKTFDDVSGQEHITAVLKSEIMSGRLSHAYLFTGTRGTGKTTCAKILSKAVNCLSPREGNPCCECEICRGIEDGSIFDVVEIDAASNNGVDNIRDLREAANYTPAAAKYRVYIIDEVHMLSIGAFNALLKTLEEPPEHVIFILATTEVHKLPATILSRCQRFDFHRIGVEYIAARVREVCEREELTIEEDASLLIASLADGALRDALSLLDRCISGTDPITCEQVMRSAGLAGREYLFAIADAVDAQNTAKILQFISELYAAACDMERLCEELIGFYRDLMVVRVTKDPVGLITASSAETQRLTEMAKRISLAQILSALDVLQEASAVLKRGGSKRTELEMALIRLACPQAQFDEAALLRRIADLESGVRIAAPKAAAPAEPIAEPKVQAVKPQPEPKQSEPAVNDLPWEEDVPMPSDDDVPAEQPEEEQPVLPPEPQPQPERLQEQTEQSVEVTQGEIAQWNDITRIISRKNPLLGAQLKGSRAYLQGEIVLIDAKFSQFRIMCKSDPKNRRDIRDAIQSVLGKDYRIGPYEKPPEDQSQDTFGAFLNQMREAGATIE
ncbi:MAG: DNA polymerase III subunit gamma/tau [Clostridia bacterium]|nr:DNA polymerase III subunit gamma/tau [Clostridia bacterium]